MGPVMRNSIRYSQKDYAVSISLFVRNARRTSLVEKLFQREISKKKKKKKIRLIYQSRTITYTGLRMFCKEPLRGPVKAK